MYNIDKKIIKKQKLHLNAMKKQVSRTSDYATPERKRNYSQTSAQTPKEVAERARLVNQGELIDKSDLQIPEVPVTDHTASFKNLSNRENFSGKKNALK